MDTNVEMANSNKKLLLIFERKQLTKRNSIQKCMEKWV